ncbi:MAG: hypothetical protein IT356_12335 [Gemmatimonadaceae bacterium]|nr:hypothetical protein [Gemmatimonadaceae bacterium]
MMAQAAWQASGIIGASARAEDGRALLGVRIEAGFRRVPLADGIAIEPGVAVVQVTSRGGSFAGGRNIKENSTEAFIRFGRTVLAGNALRLDGSVAPVISASLGCAGGGTFQADTGGTYGTVQCRNSFARKSTIRPGLALRLVIADGSGRRHPLPLIAGLDASVGTVAAGRSAAITIFAGFRAPPITR